MPENSKKYFLERPGIIKKLWMLLYVICGLTVVPDFFTHRESHFGFESFFGFYALLGFVSCAVLILVAKALGWFLKVDEDYYDK